MLLCLKCSSVQTVLMSKSRVTGNYCSLIPWSSPGNYVSLYHGKYIQDTHIRTHGAGAALLPRRTAQDGMEETEGVDRLLSTPERETGPAGQNHLHPHLLTAAGKGDRGGAGGTVGEGPRATVPPK